MDVPTPPRAVAALAAFVRERLADVPATVSGAVSGTIAPLWRGRPDGVEIVTTLRGATDQSVGTAARQFATLVVGAAAPFATTSYSRARLIRQMHATGLLTADEAHRASVALDLYDRPVIDADTPSDTPAEPPR